MFIAGRGRYARETYPERSPQVPQPLSMFAFDQNTDNFNQVQGAGPLTIATATINVAPGSRIKVEAVACVVGSVAAGIAIIFTSAILSDVASQSFDTAPGTDHRTANYLGVTDPQPGGSVTVNLQITVSGAPGARVDQAGMTVLVLTEIPAASGP